MGDHKRRGSVQAPFTRHIFSPEPMPDSRLLGTPKSREELQCLAGHAMVRWDYVANGTAKCDVCLTVFARDKPG